MDSKRRYHSKGVAAKSPQSPGPVEVFFSYPEGDLALPKRFDLRNHSPDGFQWGYGGSGPAQLALAILAHAIGPVQALRLYQIYKRDVIAQWPPYLPLDIPQEDVLRWALDHYEKEAGE